MLTHSANGQRFLDSHAKVHRRSNAKASNVSRILLVGACLLALAASACQSRTTAMLVEERDDRFGFTLKRPAGWVRVAEGDTTVRFVPPADADRSTSAAEFIVVHTFPAGAMLTDAEMRRQVFSLLPIHGVSGFQQDPRSTPEALWYKFEVTGSTDGVEWASVGVVASGPRRFHVTVCAKPLDRWRQGQKQCDEVMRSFQPGNLR